MGMGVGFITEESRLPITDSNLDSVPTKLLRLNQTENYNKALAMKKVIKQQEQLSG